MNETLRAYEFKHCFAAGIVKATIDDIAEAGWPICPECGDDMERISRPDKEQAKPRLWYVKDDDIGSIYGPFDDREAAEQCANRLDSGRIIEDD